MLSSLLPWGAALLAASTVVAQTPPQCGLDKRCPKEAPCCSQYNQCGTGAFCLGGCNPRTSFSLDSCLPVPVCKDKKFSMDSMKGIVDISEYLGDPAKADWVAQGEPRAFNGNVLLTMPPQSVGTVLSSTVYMWYGSVKAKIKTARGRGVVTAFILFSPTQDEIDYEWVGVDLEAAQTNYYFQGIPKYTESGNITTTDSFYNWHEYEIRWTPDQITWLVDGDESTARTKKRADTWNKTASQWDYPQTPSRVQLSIWPGGAPTNGQGTIDWAGGPIDWNGDDIKRAGYYYATIGEVEIKCFNANSPPGTNKGTSYSVKDYRGTNDTIVDGDGRTTIKSLLGTGLDKDAGEETTSGKAPEATHAQVPGGSSKGPGQDPVQNAGNGGGSSGGGGDGGGAGAPSGDACPAGTWSQHGCGPDSPKSEAVRPRDSLMGASAFAALIAVAGLFWM